MLFLKFVHLLFELKNTPLAFFVLLCGPLGN